MILWKKQNSELGIFAFGHEAEKQEFNWINMILFSLTSKHKRKCGWEKHWLTQRPQSFYYNHNAKHF